MSELERDKNGRLFRRYGNSIVYETDLITTGGCKAETPKQERTLIKAGRIEFEEETEMPLCPFSNGMRNNCKKDCAFFGGQSCVLALKDCPEECETLGDICPLGKSRKCADSCALYNDGCSIIQLIHALKTAGKCGENEKKE